MALTNKSIASTYGDILQVDNSGSGRTANGTAVKDGLGQSTALTLGQNKAKITPSSNSTDTLVVENAAGADLLVVDSTNSLIKAGTTNTYVNTQIKEFGVFDFSPTADIHYPMVAMTGLDSASNTDWQAVTGFGSGTDPAGTLTVSSGAENMVPVLWYVPVAITIDEVRVIASTDASDTLNFHLFSYTMATGTSSGAGDLSSGALLAHNSDVTNAGNEQAYLSTWTVDSANVDANKAILCFFRSDSISSDFSVVVTVKYFLRQYEQF